MKDQEITSNSFTEKIKSAFNKVHQQTEELAVQFSLGKAEAGDKFDEMKKELHSKTHELKQSLAKAETFSKEKAAILKVKLEELQVQLALGKAEAKEGFEKQKKNIMHLVNEIKAELKK